MYLGAYLGLDESTVVVAPSGPDDVQPVETPYTAADPQYVDHIARAIERLCQYAKSDDFSYDPMPDQLGFDTPLGGGLG